MRLLLIAWLWLPLAASANPPVVLILGDSLSAGYGIATHEGWVARLAHRLAREGLPHQVINASVSGETTAGGLTRLPPLLAEHRPAVLVIELGANDGLRGLDFEVIRANLGELVDQGRAGGAQVLLVGVRLPPNYGASYTQGFQDIFREVSAARGVPLVADLLRDVAEHWDLMQADGLHPTAEAQERILDNLWPTLQPLLTASSPNPP